MNKKKFEQTIYDLTCKYNLSCYPILWTKFRDKLHINVYALTNVYAYQRACSIVDSSTLKLNKYEQQIILVDLIYSMQVIYYHIYSIEPVHQRKELQLKLYDSLGLKPIIKANTVIKLFKGNKLVWDYQKSPRKNDIELYIKANQTTTV